MRSGFFLVHWNLDSLFPNCHLMDFTYMFKRPQNSVLAATANVSEENQACSDCRHSEGSGGLNRSWTDGGREAWHCSVGTLALFTPSFHSWWDWGVWLDWRSIPLAVFFFWSCSEVSHFWRKVISDDTTLWEHVRFWCGGLVVFILSIWLWYYMNWIMSAVASLKYKWWCEICFFYKHEVTFWDP